MTDTAMAELTERLIAALDLDWERDPLISTHQHIVQVALAEIAAAGFVLVEAERFERLRHNAGIFVREFPIAEACGMTPPDREKRLRPGDLEPADG